VLEWVRGLFRVDHEKAAAAATNLEERLRARAEAAQVKAEAEGLRQQLPPSVPPGL
jgi:hypothetical protein